MNSTEARDRFLPPIRRDLALATRSTSFTSPLLDLLFDDPLAGRCLVAPDGTILRANAEWLRSTGFALEDVLGEDIVALFPETRDMALALHARARAGHHVDVPRHAQRVAGRDTWWEGSLDPVPMHGGTGLLVTARQLDAAPRSSESYWEPASSRLMQDVLDGAPSIVFLKDLDGRFITINKRLEQLLGTTREQLRGKTDYDVFPAAAAEYYRAHDRKVLETRQLLQIEETAQFPDGSRHVFLANKFPVYDDAGRLYGVCGISHDITDRDRAEEALRESEARFRLLAEAMPQIVCVLRSDGRAEYVNPRWFEFSGMDTAATEAAGWAGVLHPDDLPAARACRLRALKLQTPQEVELRYRAADGSFRWFLSRLAPVVEAGRVVRLVGAAMEIEDRKRAEQALRESEARSRAISDNVRDLLVLLEAVRDPGGALTGWRYVDANESAVELLGTTRAALVGRTVADVLPDRGAAVAAQLARVLATGSPEQYERDLGARTFLIKLFRVGWDRVGVAAVDITDRKRAEIELRRANEALREADRRKDEFLGMLSHELRNPLAPIRNALYILDHARPEGEQARRAKEIATRQVAHLTRLVDDLLDITRIARAKVELRREDLDLAGLALRTAEDYRPLMHDRGLDLTVDVPRDPVVVHGDAARLTQILGNLLNNAAKFTPAGGRVTLSMSAEGERAVVHVRDTGPGIAPEVLPTIFEPFTQGKQTLARSEGGLGLGLSLVKGLVALHGGEVRALSVGAGEGTDFVVSLPLAAGAGPLGAATPIGGTAGAAPRRRVLVIDDNRDAADTLAELVEMLGHEPVVAYDAVSGLERAVDQVPDVVLCDLGLPGMDGYEFARQLRARAAGLHLRLVALSGYAQPEDVAKAAEAGFDVHVAKPPDPEQIRRLLA